MAARKAYTILKNRILFAGVLATLLTYGAPARADAIDAVWLSLMSAAQAAATATQQLQADWASTVQSFGQYLQSTLSTMVADTGNANNRQNVDVAAAQKLAMDSARPSNHSACRNAQRAVAIDQDRRAGAALTQAFAQSMANRPATAGMNAQEMNARCNSSFNFAPTASNNPNDPEASGYSALKCPSDGSHARQDVTIESLIGPLEYPVPPDLQPPVNGQYKPLTTLTNGGAKDYHPFAAALAYCEHITARLPTPPQGTGSTATIDLAALGPYADMESKASVAPASCLRAMTRRMQFGQEVPNFQSLYQSQVDRCTADNNAHIIDAVTLADCMQNGRSDLEAEHDEAYRAETKEYQGNVLNQLQFDNEILAGIATTDAEARFEQSLVTERGQLIQALQTAEGIGQVASGPLSMPVAP